MRSRTALLAIDHNAWVAASHECLVSFCVFLRYETAGHRQLTAVSGSLSAFFNSLVLTASSASPPPPPNLGKPKAWLLTFNDLTLKTGNQSPVSNSYRELDCAKDYDWLLKWRHCANGLVMHTPILRVHAIPGSFLVSIRYSVNTFRICDSQ